MEESTAILNNYKTMRIDTINKLKLENINPYPHKFNITQSYEDYIKFYSFLKDGERISESNQIVSGRVIDIREASSKLIFMTCFANNYKLQYVFSREFYITPENFIKDIRTISRGDIVGVSGFPGKTKHGELSIFVRSFQILTPCLDVIPKNYYGISDSVDTPRYLDMIVNQELGKTMKLKSTVISYIRKYLDDLNFTEVFTPILQNKAGGAQAKPFITHHNDLNIDMVMRIAPELYLKQLIVGGMERVYEIGQQFRNEGIDITHNPEFMSLEFYMAYADYNDLMNIAEELLSRIVYLIKGQYEFEYFNTKLNKLVKIDFRPPFKRIDFMQELSKNLGKFPEDYTTDEMKEFLISACKNHNIDCGLPHTIPRLLDKLADHFIETQCLNPTFVINHPLIMSPLAKWHRDDNRLTERFELFANYFELCNAYTELNDPLIQKKTFEKQMIDKQNGDDEAQEIDEVFIHALEIGLPPTGGFGLGIERFIMLLSNKSSIKDVISFPAHK